MRGRGLRLGAAVIGGLVTVVVATMYGFYEGPAPVFMLGIAAAVGIFIVLGK